MVAAMVEIKPAPTLDVSSLVRARACVVGDARGAPGSQDAGPRGSLDRELGHEPLALADIDVNAPDEVRYNAHHARPTIAPGVTEELKRDVTANGDAYPGDAHAVLLLWFLSGTTRVSVAVGQPV